MLYHIHELHRAVLEPWHLWAKTGVSAFGSSLSPMAYVPNAKSIAAGFDLVLRLTQRYARPDFGIHQVQMGRERVAIVEEIVLDKPFCNLLHFAKEKRVKKQSPILVFAPLSGHYATLLRDTVRTMLPDYDVYITDWKDARDIPLNVGEFHFDDYVAYVREFIRTLGTSIHVVSVCQPTVPVLAGISLMASEGEPTPLTMTMMGGPIDTRRSPTSVNDFAKQRPISWFEQHVIQRVPLKYAGAMRRVYPGFLQLAGFIAMNPGRHMESHRDYYNNLIKGDGESTEAHRHFYNEYNAVMDLPAEYYLDTIVRVFHEQRLARGTLEVAGQPVRPEAIEKTALFTIEGELDDISGNGQTEAAQSLCLNIPKERKQHFLAKGVGHYGIFSGRKYRETIYPKIREFIVKNSRN